MTVGLIISISLFLLSLFLLFYKIAAKFMQQTESTENDLLSNLLKFNRTEKYEKEYSLI